MSDPRFLRLEVQEDHLVQFLAYLGIGVFHAMATGLVPDSVGLSLGPKLVEPFAEQLPTEVYDAIYQGDEIPSLPTAVMQREAERLIQSLGDALGSRYPLFDAGWVDEHGERLW
jgi:hypothetical protein